jgi:hypothetical protein
MSQHRPVIATQKPVTVEAMRWYGMNSEQILNWIHGAGVTTAHTHEYEPWLIIADGIAEVNVGDWIIRDRFNDFFPLPHDTYRAVYDSPVQ